jgi:lysozyme
MLLFVLSGCLSDLTRHASDPWRGLDPRHPPSGFEVYGIDVSHHQGPIDWAEVGASREVDFVYVKATEGRYHRDRRFAENWSGARDAGLWVGAYHYFSACRTGAEQAEHFLATVPIESDALPPVVDIEPDRHCNTDARMAGVGPELAVWIERVADETGLQPVVYSSARVHGDFQRTVDDEAVRDAPRWVASWSRGPTHPWTIWQYSDRTSVPGISGPVDGDVFRGSLDDLMELVAP